MSIGHIPPAQVWQQSHATQIHHLQGMSDIHQAINSIQELYTHYAKLFGDPNTIGSYERIKDNILKQFNTVIQLIGKKTYAFPLDLQAILDENQLTIAEETCLWGNKVYKDYLREIVHNANSLHAFIDKAQSELRRLKALIEAQAKDTDTIPCLNNLGILDQHANEATKAFSEYCVVETGGVKILAYELYFDQEKYSLLSTRSFTQNTVKEIDLTNTFTSKIKPEDSVSLDTLRNIESEKYQYDVYVINKYCIDKKDEKGEKIKVLTDRFNPDAYVSIEAEWGKPKTSTSVIALFNEFTLLDKLKYIVLYYTLNGERYVFPNDPKTGIPCIPTHVSTDPVKDTAEIGHVELFFIGYLTNHYNAIYALALFMETKVNALISQTKMLQRRIAALKFYLNLSNRGLQALNQSQANGNASISNDAYCALRYLGANITRTSIQLTINGSTDTYVVLQGVSNNPTNASHYTKTDNYLLIKADNNTIQNFFYYVTGTGYKFPYSYDHVFDYDNGELTNLLGAYQSGYITQEQYLQLLKEGYGMFDPCTIGIGRAPQPIQGYADIYQICYQCRHQGRGTEWKKEAQDCGIYILHAPNHNNLPKELETNRLDISPILVKNYAGSENTWNNYVNDKQGSWTALVKCWITDYQTTIENTNTEVTATQKTVSTYRNKMSTFESNAANCIKKLNLMYNQVVNKI